MSLQEELRGPPPAFALERSEKARLPRRNEVKAGRIFNFPVSAPKTTA
jgi:hypothetical protein